MKPYQAAILLAAIFSDLNSRAVFSTSLGESSDSEVTINETTLGVVPPTPHREPFFHKTIWSCYFNNSSTTPLLASPLNSHTTLLSVSQLASPAPICQNRAAGKPTAP